MSVPSIIEMTCSRDEKRIASNLEYNRMLDFPIAELSDVPEYRSLLSTDVG